MSKEYGNEGELSCVLEVAMEMGLGAIKECRESERLGKKNSNLKSCHFCGVGPCSDLVSLVSRFR